MGKSFGMDSSVEVRSSFFERRKLRRIRMIVELTLNLIGTDTTVSHREARCLVRCARKAILDLYPGFDERYDRIVRPHFDRVLHERWPGQDVFDMSDCSELVN